ncbi:LuxR family transcriptional regulator [Actinocorallia aurea]
MLYGRDGELGVLSGLISRAAGGEGGALLVRGEAGIGKTALLEASRESAVRAGCRVLSAVGVQSEASLPFAGLHQLLRPVLDRSGALTARQQQELLAAFGIGEGSAPGLFSVGMASLELVSAVAEDGPVLMVIDDAQWVDAPSSEALAFMARRLDAERAVMLLAVREGHDTVLNDAGLAEMQVARLDGEAARALVGRHAPALDRSLRDRVLAEADGNPLALVELPSALRGGGGGGMLMPWLPTTRRLERAFLSRVLELPKPAQAILLVAAANDRGDLAEILKATQVLEDADLSVGALEPAMSADLVDLIEHEVRFQHPLIRSAIYQAAPVSRRLAAHAALAAALDRYQERRAWHRAAASPAPDDEVALDLEAAAAKALDRGAPRAAVQALQRAAALSDPDTHRGRLLLRSAEINFELGDIAAARRQLAEASSVTLQEGQRLRLTLWMEAFSEESLFSPDRVRAFADVADRLAGVDRDGASLALRALWQVAISCWYGNPTQETRDLIVNTARRLARGDVDAMVLSIAACADPVSEAAWVIDEVTRMPPGTVDDPVEQHALGASLTAIWAFDLAWPLLSAAIDGLRRQGRLGLLGEALGSQAWSALHLGKHRLAMAAADESSRLSRDTGRPLWALVADLAKAALASEEEDYETATRLIRETEAGLMSGGAPSVLGYSQFARGRYAMVSNQYGDAFDEFARVLDPSDLAYHPFVGYWAIADLIEAAARSGRSQDAARHLADLEALADTTKAPFLIAMAAYARPFTVPDTDAEPLYQQALQTRLVSWPAHRARLLLAYGQWLRRQRRLTDARRPLRAAVEGLDGLGIKAIAKDARAELRAAGEAVTHAAPDALDSLTPQELQIARLAAQGMTNREIGGHLFLSHRTVSHHLYNIFPKLGITSRGQLRTIDLADE